MHASRPHRDPGRLHCLAAPPSLRLGEFGAAALGLRGREVHRRGGPGGRCGPWGAAWGPGPREGKGEVGPPSIAADGPRGAQSWVSRSDLSPPRGTAAGSPVLSRLQRRREDPACPLGKPLHAKGAFGQAWSGGRVRGGPRSCSAGAAAGFQDRGSLRTRSLPKGVFARECRADPRFAGEPLGRVRVRPRELPLYSCCERGGAARGREGTATLKVGKSALLR